MLRHSLNTNFEGRKKEYSQREIQTISKAKQYLKSSKFHQQLSQGFRRWISMIEEHLKNKKSSFFSKPPLRTQLIWITLPKPKFAKTKVPIGLPQDKINEIKEKIIFEQSHVVEDAIDRVSFSREIIEYVVSKIFSHSVL